MAGGRSVKWEKSRDMVTRRKMTQQEVRELYKHNRNALTFHVPEANVRDNSVSSTLTQTLQKIKELKV